MEKKKYIKPSTEVYEMKGQPRLLAGSYEGGGLGQIPTIPGQPADEKQLA